jgi:hypothetical protein
MLNEVKDEVKKGDIVLLSLEYFLDEGDYNIKMFSAELYPAAKNYIEFPTVMDELKANGNYTFRELRNYLLLSMFSNENQTDDKAYTRKAFNRNGDVREELRLISKLPLKDGGIIESKNYGKSLAKINEFIKSIEHKEAKVFFIFPPLAESQYNLNKKAIEILYQQYKSELKTEIINTPIDSVYPDSCFYDTIYHLRSPFHTLHTKRVLKDLKQ